MNAVSEGLRSHDPLTRARAAIARCHEHGFILAGIADAKRSSHAAEYQQWIAAQKHGNMAYLAAEVEKRLDPAALVPGARSVLCVADRYSDGRSDARHPGFARIARYARGEDYHLVIRARLGALAKEFEHAFPGERFRPCVDTAPILEREHAARAGLGRIGKHTLLIAPRGVGTWVLLGVLVTTLELAPIRAESVATDGHEFDGMDLPLGSSPITAMTTMTDTDPCGACTRCIDACPTGAITPWSVDARRCISTATIEERSSVNELFAGHTLDWVFGCDTCQEVCPHSQPTLRSRGNLVHEAYTPHRSGFPLLEILGWTDEAWDLAQLNGVLRRADRVMWQRNAALAAGSAIQSSEISAQTRSDLLARLNEISHDSAAPEMLRAAARLSLRLRP